MNDIFQIVRYTIKGGASPPFFILKFFIPEYVSIVPLYKEK